MERTVKRLIVLCLCIATVAGFIPALPPAVTADAATANTSTALYADYTTVAMIPTQSGCPSMQGFDVDDTYLYCAKINTTTETSATIARTHKDTGTVTWLKNSATGTVYFSQIAHANDLAVTEVQGVKTLFVGTGGAGKGDYSLVRFALSGTTLTEVAHYNVKVNGTELYLAGVKVMCVSDSEIKLILKSSNKVYTATVGADQASSDVAATQLCTLNFSEVNFGGTVKDISSFVQQGFGYYDNKIFVPMTGNSDASTVNVSTIICYDINGVSGTIKNDPSMSVWITSATYADLFEIESCTICPSDGVLYFGTNRRVTASDGNHDGVHYVQDFIYDPAMGDSPDPANYRWEIGDGTLKSVTTGGAVYDHPIQHLGSISGSTLSDARFSLDQTVYLDHDQPWIIEWKSSSWTGNALLLSTYSKSGYAGNYFLFRRKNSDLIAFGEYTGSQYDNYGLKLSDHGVDGSKEHVYRLENRIAADGTNMVYLLVDGTELGAMNNYYIASTAQGTTSDWISGKDFAFSYMGTSQHPLNCTMEYLQIWDKGVLSEVDEPNIYRWETQSDALTNVESSGLTTNAVTTIAGSCTDGMYSSAHFSIDQEIVLLHDRPWTVEWQSEGSGTARFISTFGSSRMTPYILKSNLVAMGYYDGTQYNNFGLRLSDFGFDSTTSHVYRMTNRIADDGSNMVYLYVDGVELGAMNKHYIGGTDQGTTSDWISGQDFTFGYIGTFQHPINNFTIDYLQIWENGIPAEDTANRYRWEPDGSRFASISSGNYAQNDLTTLSGSVSNGSFTEAYYRLEQSIVLLHDRPWSISWQSEGTWYGGSTGAMLLSASINKNEPNAPFLYRRKNSDLIGFGSRTASSHENYGIRLSDYGIDGAAAHTYMLTNRINADGSNMVYLYVDGAEVGPMNSYFIGGTAQGTTSNWISGKDFVFHYMGTPQFPISSVSMDYFEVNEGCTHSYGDWSASDASCTADGTQTRTCSICGATETRIVTATGHSYVSGSCSVCGAADPGYMVVPTLSLQYPTLAFEDEILYNAYFTVDDASSVVEMGMITFSSKLTDGTIDDAAEVIPGYYASGSSYVVTSSGIPAKNLGDALYFKVYAKLSDGTYAYSSVAGYNAIAYANTILKSTASDTSKALVVAMLNYGAAAQTYFGYNTSNLMNANFSAYQYLVQAYDESMVADVIAVDSAKGANFVMNAAGWSNVYPSVSFEGAFSINYFFTNKLTPDDGITFYYWDQATYESVDVLTTSNATQVIAMTQDGSNWTAAVQGIAAKEIDETIFVAGVYTSDGVTYTTRVIPYSLGKYCETIAAQGNDFGAATAVYGYYAKAYFAS